MKVSAILVTALLAAATCQAAVYPGPEMREKNWPRSCVWSSTATALNVAGHPQGAAFVRKYCRGGVDLRQLAPTLRGFGLTIRTNFSGDASFLETTNCAIIHYGYKHAVLFCGFEGEKAIISDPNRKSLQSVAKSTFIRKWKIKGRAVALD